MNKEQPYCFCTGENCPLKQDCKRFREDLDKKKEYHFAKAPIKDNGTCFHFDKKNEADIFFDKIKNICRNES